MAKQETQKVVKAIKSLKRPFNELELTALMQAICPGASLECDNDDQIVIYTDCMFDDSGKAVQYVMSDDEDEDYDDED